MWIAGLWVSRITAGGQVLYSDDPNEVHPDPDHGYRLTDTGYEVFRLKQVPVVEIEPKWHEIEEE